MAGEGMVEAGGWERKPPTCPGPSNMLLSIRHSTPLP